MKLAVFCLLSLLCVQAALGASLQRPEGSTELQSKRESAVSFFTSDEKAFELRLNPIACIPAFKDIWSLTWQSWNILQERKAILKKATEGRENCHKLGGTPEDLEKCLQVVEDEQKAAQEVLNGKIWQLMPQVFTALLALFKCLF